MTKRNSTKKALLMSTLSLLLCFSMLIGTTFAWFTDSVTSAGNIIKSGDLEVLMHWADGTKAFDDSADWKDASKEAIFKNSLWEPGYVDVKHIKITNNGSLALKYQLFIEPTGEVQDLADVIDVYVIKGGETIADRVSLAGKEPVGTLSEVIDSFETLVYGDITVAEKSDVFTIALKMRESAGNDYENKQIGSEFAVKVLATQLAYEGDSFDEKYDEEAVYADHYATTAADLVEATRKGGTVALMNDIDLTAGNNARAVANHLVVIPKGISTTILLNGNNILGVSANDSVNQSVFQVKGDLTVLGTGKVEITHTGADMGWNNLSAVFSVEGGTLTLGKNVSVVHNGGTSMAYGVDVNSTLGATTLNVNGATIYSTYTGVRLFSNHKTQAATVNFNEGFIEGENRDIWNQIASASIPAENGVVNIAEGYNYTTEATSNGGAKYFFGDYLVATDDEGFDDALKAGATTLILSSGNYVIPDSAQGKTLTIVGNGDTVVATQDDGSYEGCDYSLDGATVTFENIVINTDSTTYTGYARLKATYNNCVINGTYTLYDDSVFNNCTFNVTGDVYNIWTWGAPKATFNGCTFNNSGKAILLYGGSDTVLTVTDCVFNDKNDVAGVDNKAAIEVGSDWATDKKTIVATNCTVNGFDVTNKGLDTGSTLWGNKNSLSADRLNVTINGTKVYGN